MATPIFTVPSSAGQFSNKRGSDTGVDAILFSFRNPSGPIGTIRALTSRVATGDVLVSPPQLLWDAGFTGTPTTVAWQPLSGGPSPATTAVWAGAVGGPRVYAAEAGGTSSTTSSTVPLVSASYQGGTTGAWRPERGILFNSPGSDGALASLTMVYNYGRPMLYAMDAQTNMAYATLNPNGTVNQWVQINNAAGPIQPGRLYGNQDPTPTKQGWLGVIGGNPVGPGQTAVGNVGVQNIGLNADGSLQRWVSDTALPAALAGFGFYYDPFNGFVVVAGGNDGSGTPQAAIYTAKVGDLGGISAWSTQTHALPVAKSQMGLLVENGYIFALCGTTTGAVAGGSSTIHSATLALTVGTGQVGTWSSALTPTFPTASSFGAWFLAGPVGGAGTFSYLACAGPSNTSDVQLTAVNEILDNGSGGMTGSWNNGSHSLVVGDLGAGGVLATNADGSQAVTFAYSAFGTTPVISGGGVDGDRLQMEVAVTDPVTGLISAVAITNVRIGQPPTITSTSPANSSTPAGAFTATFAYAAGAGGGKEASWRVDEEEPAGTVVADSGTVNGMANNFATRAPLALANSPIPATGQTGAVKFLVQSTDISMQMDSGTSTATSSSTLTDSSKSWITNRFAGAVVRSGSSSGIVASNTGTALTLSALGWQGGTPATGTYTISAATLALASNSVTYTGSAPATPTAVTAVADNTNAMFTVGFTTGANTATARVWHRTTAGPGPWLLARDNVPATGSPQTVQIMEPLGLKVAYDFAVSGVSSDPVEGSKSSVVSGVMIDPLGGELANHFDAGGYQAMLSVMGNGPAQHAGLWVDDGKVTIERELAAEVTQMFGAAAPSARYGTVNYRQISLALTQRIADIPGLEAVLGAVSAVGATLVYRDIFNGGCIYCVLPNKRAEVEDLYLGRTLVLIESSAVFAP